jgi:hypothetical protein
MQNPSLYYTRQQAGLTIVRGAAFRLRFPITITICLHPNSKIMIGKICISGLIRR